MSNAYKPKSKRRKMKAFKLEEISVVDKPAQAGAVATIMKRAGELCVGQGATAAMVQKETEMTDLELLQKQMRDCNAKLNRILKAGPTDLRGQERARPYQVDQNGEGPEFEKEPEDFAEEEYEEEDDGDEVEKERVHRPGRTAAQHRGDWPPGSADPETGAAPPKGTRVDNYVFDDESNEMDAERASEVLQPYAHGGEEDEDEEEVQRAVGKLADRLAKRFPRASNASIEKMVEGALHSSRVAYDPRFGREREYAKRATARDQSNVRKGYSDEVLLDRLQKRFGASFERNFDKNFSKYFR
jgi:hypothetical protein